KRIENRYVILSNNSTDTSASMGHLLKGLGITVDPNRLLLAGEQTIRFMAEEYPSARVMLIGSLVIQRFARRMKLNLVKDRADFVVLARDKRFDYERLSLVVNELRRGAKLVVTNPDLCHPGEEGQIVPETGTLMRAVIACTGVVPAHVIGKPQ